jgi:hypothetical protein
VSLQIIDQIDQFDQLKESNAYQILEFCRKRAEGFEQLVVNHKQMLQAEIEKLKDEADRLLSQITELSGKHGSI